MVWLVFAGMTLVALAGLLWPLWRARASEISARSAGVAIYEAQLAEIERDRRDGRASDADASAARTEAARRLLAESRDRSPASPSTSRRGTAIAITLVSLAACAALYVRIGQPTMPDMPLASRAAPSSRDDLATALARIEAHLAREPDDLRGWSVIAPVYLRLGRGDDAARAYAAILRLGGDTAEHHADYGEALVYAANGVVTADARREFETAVARDAKAVKPRYYLGLAAEQDGSKARAKEMWTALAADQPTGSPLARALAERMAALDGKSPAQDIADLPAEAQGDAIRGMVERLSARLQEKGGDLAEWLRLVRAYRVLNEGDKARAALADARRHFASDEAAKTRLDALAQELGIGG